MNFKEFKNLKDSIRAFFIKTDLEEAKKEIEAHLNLNEEGFGQYSYEDALKDLTNTIDEAPLASHNPIRNYWKLKEDYGFDAQFLFERLREKPEILLKKEDDEFELLKQTLDMTSKQVEKMLEVKTKRLKSFNDSMQEQHLEFIKQNAPIGNLKWTEQEVDKIYKPTSFGEKIRYNWHKNATLKKYDKLIELVDNKKITLDEMRNILPEFELNGYWSNPDGILAVPNEIFYNAFKANKNIIADISARFQTTTSFWFAPANNENFVITRQLAVAKGAAAFGISLEEAQQLLDALDNSPNNGYNQDKLREQCIRDAMQEGYAFATQQHTVEQQDTRQL